MTKKELEILKLYSGFSDERIKEMYMIGIIPYLTLVKSERIARKLLNEYGIFFYYQHEELKHEFRQIFNCMRLRNLTFFPSVMDVEVNLEDVVERIRENEAKRIDDIHKYIYLKYHNKLNSYDREIPEIKKELDILMNDVMLLYDSIVNDLETKAQEKKFVK